MEEIKNEEELTIESLINAIDRNDFDFIQKIVAAKPELLSETYCENTPFAYFVASDEPPFIESYGKESYMKVLEFFLDKKAPFIDRELFNMHKGTPHFATNADIMCKLSLDSLYLSVDEFEYIRKKLGLDNINFRNYQGRHLLSSPQLINNEIKSHLLESPELDISSKDNDGNGLVHNAAGCLDLDVLKKLISLGAAPNDTNNEGLTPLAYMMLMHEKQIYYDEDGYYLEKMRHIARWFLDKGGVFDLNNPAVDISVIKSLNLGYLPDPQEAIKLFDRIVCKLKGQTTLNKKGEKVSSKIAKRIPEERNLLEFNAFAEVVGKVYAFTEALGHRNTPDQISVMLVELIENTDGSWQKVRDSLRNFSEADCKDMADAIRGFTESVVLPEVAQRTRNRARMVDYKAVIDRLLPDVAAVIVGDRPLSTMLKLSSAWHHRLPALDNMRTIQRIGSWEKATDDFTASNGYVITFLDTADKLSLEGKELDHCVGGYTEECKNQGTHIASIRKVEHCEDGDHLIPVSTVEFMENLHARVPLKINQHRGQNNITPSNESPESIALKEFMSKIDTAYCGADRIIIDFNRILARRSEIARGNSIGDVKYMIGYDPLDDSAPDNQDKYFAQYLEINAQLGRTNSFIPGGKSKWSKCTAEDFLVETKLMDKIINISRNPPLVENKGMPWP